MNSLSFSFVWKILLFLQFWRKLCGWQFFSFKILYILCYSLLAYVSALKSSGSFMRVSLYVISFCFCFCFVFVFPLDVFKLLFWSLIIVSLGVGIPAFLGSRNLFPSPGYRSFTTFSSDKFSDPFSLLHLIPYNANLVHLCCPIISRSSLFFTF